MPKIKIEKEFWQDEDVEKQGDGKDSLELTGKKCEKNENENMSKIKLRKFLRNAGQEYVTKKGKVVKAKIFENKHCGCSKECLTKITYEQRRKCFENFWKMVDFGKQNAYLTGLVTREAVKQHRPRLNCTNRGPKGSTYRYHINIGRVRRQVCKVYFLETFLVSSGRLARALRKERNKKDPGEDLRGKKSPYNKTSKEQLNYVRNHIKTENNEMDPGEDLRSQTPPANKTSEEQLNCVRNHINQFPRYDSDCVQNSKGKYLECDLNVKKMYEMYIEQCTLNSTPFVEENVYRNIFSEEFNLTFLSSHGDPFNCSVKLEPPDDF